MRFAVFMILGALILGGAELFTGDVNGYPPLAVILAEGASPEMKGYAFGTVTGSAFSGGIVGAIVGLIVAGVSALFRKRDDDE